MAGAADTRAQGRGEKPRWAARAVIGRFALCLMAWLAIAGGGLVDLPAGLLAAAAGAWLSLVLITPSAVRLSFPGLLRFMARFVVQSAVAGFDVARRVFDPKLPLAPGYVRYATNVPPGESRAAFCAVMSLFPGTMPVADEADGTLLIHCLDVTQPVAEQMRADERCYRAMWQLPVTSGHDA